MTAQISDIFKYQNEDYSVVAVSKVIPFKPENFGLEPQMSSTACWRGYWCEYNIINDKFLLNKLYFHNMEGNYPPFNGVEVSPQEFVDSVVYNLNDKKSRIEKSPAHSGHRLYKNVNLLIPYTGKIMLGKGFLSEYCIHMGFQRGWAYEKLIELSFENGKLVDYKDLSHKAKEQREILENHRNEKDNNSEKSLKEIFESVNKSFSLDYSDKVWWK